MVAARFVLVPGRGLGGRSASWPDRSGLIGDTLPDGTWFAWRLLGGNNRELGRAPAVHAGEAECLAGVEALRERLADAALGMVADADHLSWRWRLTHDGQVLAVSGRSYQRHRECHYSAALFRSAAADPTTRLPVPDARAAAGGTAVSGTAAGGPGRSRRMPTSPLVMTVPARALAPLAAVTAR